MMPGTKLGIFRKLGHHIARVLAWTNRTRGFNYRRHFGIGKRDRGHLLRRHALGFDAVALAPDLDASG
jgi:hypothetical protein